MFASQPLLFFYVHKVIMKTATIDAIQIIIICIFILFIVINQVNPAMSVITQKDIERANLSQAIENISHEEHEEDSEPVITPTFIFWR